MQRLFEDSSSPRHIAPGAVHLPGFLDDHQQIELWQRCIEWAKSPAPARSPRIRGGQMSVLMTCLGRYWVPYRYTDRAIDTDNTPVPPMPDDLVALGQQAVAAAYSDELRTAFYTPDVAMLNYYNDTATMGMHQDKDEHIDAPIVSISLGNSCVFRFGNCATRTKPYRDVTLHSGDVFVFGGESRMAFHGVTKVLPHPAPRTLPGGHQRINITLRMTGI